MHNTPLANAEFRVTFTETNLRWLCGEVPQDSGKIARAVASLENAKNEVTLIRTKSQ